MTETDQAESITEVSTADTTIERLDAISKAGDANFTLPASLPTMAGILSAAHSQELFIALEKGKK